MIDIHTHLLFGVDDGPDTIEESIEMLQFAKTQGVDAMILTPHYRHGMFSYPYDVIGENYARLKPYADKIGVQIYLGTEHHVNSMIIEYIETQRVRTLANTQYVLAEYKHDTEFEYIAKSVQDLLRNGYIPVIAHVERCICMHQDLDRIDWLRDLGVMIQVNANAILGMEGFKVKGFTKKLLKYGYVDFVASDSHDMKKRVNNMGKCRDYLYKKYDERYVDKLLELNAMEILQSIDR